jgi:gliding motility-associated-like protein
MRLLFLICLFIPNIILSQTESNRGLLYIENKGQWDEEIKFKAEIEGANLWVLNNQLTFDFVSEEDMIRLHEELHDNKYSSTSDGIIRHHAYKVNFLGANEEVEYLGMDPASTYYNYFLGNDSSKWAGNVQLSKLIVGSSLYDGIDIKGYSNGNHFKYDLIVHPGADPGQIILEYDGAPIALTHKQLRVELSIGEVIENAPLAYQMIDGKKHIVKCAYKVDGQKVTFDFPNTYDASYDLIIDPELIFSTYTGSTADNWGFTATYDDQGFLYGGGIVFSSGYPITTGAFDQVFNGGAFDIGITKYNTDGSNLVYSTYLGGNLREWPHSLMVDSENQLVVFGSSESEDYPVTDGAYNTVYNGGSSDIIITKFNASGSSLIASTYLGGSLDDGRNISTVLRHNYGDDSRGEVFIDVDDRIYIASMTHSSDFPTTALSEEQNSQGGQDAIVASFTPDLDSLIFSTYLGGSQDDAAYSIKKRGSLIVAVGGTASANFPSTSTAMNPTYLGGSTDGFVLSLDSNGSIYNSSFIGTSAYDQAYFVEIDAGFHVYLTGQTEGAYPVSSGVYFNTNGSQFVQEMTSELSQSILSTVFGTGGTDIDISLTAFLVDQCDHVYISGWGGIQSTGSTIGLPITSDAYQSTTDGNDFYFIVFDKDFEDLLYATFFGGFSVGEHVDGGTSRFDDNGVIYQAVCAGCGGLDAFPTTPGAWSQTNGSFNCNLGTLKMEFNFQGLYAEATVNDSVYCEDPPFLVPFHGSGEDVEYHFWSFGDGEYSNLENPIHEYAEAGSYDVQYIVIDSNTCNISDTAYTTVTLVQKEVFSMVWESTPPSLCDDTLRVDMAFTGTGADSLIWDMDDGTIIYNETSVTHYYYIPGQYTVTLTAFDLDCDEVAVGQQTYVLSENIISNNVAVPNIFSPNGDGYNDVFRLFSIDHPDANPLVAMDYYNVIIYNRWGRKVFESGASIQDWEWDGTINGRNADEGVYYYILLYNSLCEDEGTIRKTGYVTLVR